MIIIPIIIIIYDLMIFIFDESISSRNINIQYAKTLPVITSEFNNVDIWENSNELQQLREQSGH